MNYTNINYSVSNFSGFLDIANTSTGNYFWTGMLLMIFLVFTITFSSIMIPEGALLAAAFIGFLISLLLAYLDLVSFTYVGVFIGLTIMLIMYIIWSNRQD
jgi:uncharacterized membrane protein YedE/YeeE